MTTRVELTAEQLGIDRELAPFAFRQFVTSCENRDRGQCSVEDFWRGYRAALIDLGVWSYFAQRPPEQP